MPGEAGIGKTGAPALVLPRPTLRVLSGGCDALHTPRPLGPFIDVAEQTGGELAAVVGRGAEPGAVVQALAQELRSRPASLVLEDLHWADEATLDVLRLLGRRIEHVPALVLATYRATSSIRARPLRIVARRAAAAAVERVPLAPLTAAVAELAAAARARPGRAASQHRGQPVLRQRGARSGRARAGGTCATRCWRAPRVWAPVRAPRSTRSRSRRRALSCGCSRHSPRDELASLDECLASGMLRAERQRFAFRHEIARVAVEEALPPHRASRCIGGRCGRSPNPVRAPGPRAARAPCRSGRRRRRRCCATRRPQASGRRAWVRIARPLTSSRAR